MTRPVGLILAVWLCVSLAFKRTARLRQVSPSTTALRAKSTGGTKEVFFCDQCGTEHIKWVGRCTSCKEWNTVKPFRQAKLASIGADPATSVRSKVALKNRLNTNGDGVSGGGAVGGGAAWFGSGAALLNGGASLVPMESVELNKDVYRLPLFSDEMNRVLGGGLVRGSVTLLAGDPGIGKSTLLLQLAASIASGPAAAATAADGHGAGRTVVYISGEENQEQIAARAQRLGLSPRSTYLICDVDVDNAVDVLLNMPDGQPPALIIVDSIQTMRTAACTSGMGTVSQIRESAVRFVELAKTTGSAVLLIGHVTKSGEIAGPRVLEHMVDSVLYLEGSERAEYRLLRGVKNRFGSTSEVGVFVMTERGMEDCPNPSALFMSPSVVTDGVEGCAVAVVMEGTRPLLAEIQGLVGASSAGAAAGGTKINPRRASDGFPIQRLLLLCAVVEKRLKLALWSRDVYLNVVGGLRVIEPAADLAVVVAVVSSLTGMKIRPATAFVGEIGLAGEVRGVRNVEARVAEALKMGFTTVVVPSYGGRRSPPSPAPGTGSGGSSAGGGSAAHASPAGGPATGPGLGVVRCSSIFEVLTVGLGAADFNEIRSRLRSAAPRKRFRSQEEQEDLESQQGVVGAGDDSLHGTIVDGDDDDFSDDVEG